MNDLKEKIHKDIKRLNSLTMAEDYIRIEINLKKQETRKDITEYINSTMVEGEEIFYYGIEKFYIGIDKCNGKVIFKDKNSGLFSLLDIETFFLEFNQFNAIIRLREEQNKNEQ